MVRATIVLVFAIFPATSVFAQVIDPHLPPTTATPIFSGPGGTIGDTFKLDDLNKNTITLPPPPPEIHSVEPHPHPHLCTPQEHIEGRC